MFFEHHVWAMRALIEHCQKLTRGQLELSLPGTYGAIVPTITHIIAEDQRLLKRITGRDAERVVIEDEVFTLPELHAVWIVQAERWRAVMRGLDGLDVTLPARGAWPEVPHAEQLILLEAIQHGNDHRTHVCSVLGAHGLEVPFLCGWQFWRSTGRVVRSEAEQEPVG